MRRTLITLAAVVFSLAALGCSGDDDDGGPNNDGSSAGQSTTTADGPDNPGTTSTTAAPTTNPPENPDDGPSLAEYIQPCYGADDWTIAGEHSDEVSGADTRVESLVVEWYRECDRVIFTLTDLSPGYDVEYGTVVQDGSGNLVDVAGPVDMMLVIHAWSSGYDELDNPSRFPTQGYMYQREPGEPTLDIVAAVRAAGAFEGYTTIGLGLDAHARFRLFKAVIDDYGPSIVLEFAH